MTEDSPENSAPRPPRRPRYRGKNPRKFSEKYKEHAAALHPDIAAKVIASGKTLAGTHRPICLEEILEVLNPQAGQLGSDCTLGYGGHAEALLQRILPNGKLIACDTDPVEIQRTEDRLRRLGFGPENLVVVHQNYAGLAGLLGKLGLVGKLDFVLADLGLSSMQIDNPERGFTFKEDGPLDLRMNPQKGLPASARLAKWNEQDLTTLLEENGDLPNAAELARVLKSARPSLQRTSQLADLIRKNQRTLKLAEEETSSVIRRVFQAIRIAVNDEFSALEAFLRNLPLCLKPGGRVAILTFHSGEDRRVKHAFRDGMLQEVYSTVSEVIRPTREEIVSNSRAASAKLRWAERAEDPGTSGA